MCSARCTRREVCPTAPWEAIFAPPCRSEVMSQPPDPTPPKPPPARGSDSASGPPPAKHGLRSGSAASANRGSGARAEGRHGSGKRGRDPAKLTPARSLGGNDGETTPTAPDVGEVKLSVGEAVWCVHVLGRSRGSSDVAATPLLLLGFLPGGASPPAYDREAWVVGHTLSELTPDQLEVAFWRAVPPPDPDRPRTFFDEMSDRRRR